MERRPRRNNPDRFGVHERFAQDRFMADRMAPEPMMMSPRRLAPPRPFPPSCDPNLDPQFNPYPLLSKTLTVANIPPEYTPKHLYDLFSEWGKAEGAFVYAYLDGKGD